MKRGLGVGGVCVGVEGVGEIVDILIVLYVFSNFNNISFFFELYSQYFGFSFRF